jgi:hypothetical protein
MDQKDELALLKRRVAELEKAQPTVIDEKAAAQHRDQMHQMRERRASQDALSNYTPGQVAAMRAATSDDDAQAIVHDQRNAPRGPAGVIPSTARSTSVRVSGGSGWQNPTPIKNGLGQGR